MEATFLLFPATVSFTTSLRISLCVVLKGLSDSDILGKPVLFPGIPRQVHIVAETIIFDFL